MAAVWTLLSMAIAKGLYVVTTSWEVRFFGTAGVYSWGRMIVFAVLLIPIWVIAALAKWNGHNIAYTATGSWWAASLTYEIINVIAVLVSGLLFFGKPATPWALLAFAFIPLQIWLVSR